MKAGFCFLIFLFSTLYAFSQENKEFQKQVQKALALTYRFQFISADSLIKKIVSEYPDNPQSYILSANYFWWQLISGEDNPINRKSYKQALEKAQEKLKKTGNKTDEDLYSEITIAAFKARIDGLDKNYLKAFYHINSCLNLLKPSFGREDEFEYYLLTSGLYHYYIANSKRHFPILLPYLKLFPKGDSDLGINFLRQASNSKIPVLNIEGNYFLMKIYMDDKIFPMAVLYADKLTKDLPQNLLFMYYHFKILLDKGEKDGAIDKLAKINSALMFNKQLTENQRKYFVNLGQKDLKEYYLKNSPALKN